MSDGVSPASEGSYNIMEVAHFTSNSGILILALTSDFFFSLPPLEATELEVLEPLSLTPV